jgi:hypothetical protein
MNILISPFAKQMRNKMPHPKNYPWWPELIKLLSKHDITQLGVDGEKWLVKRGFFSKPLKELYQKVSECDVWISVDSFLPHLAYHVKKPGVVIWSVSDPNIFGYPENINLLKDRKYLRANQFDCWEAQSFIEDAFVRPEVVAQAVEDIGKKFINKG